MDKYTACKSCGAMHYEGCFEINNPTSKAHEAELLSLLEECLNNWQGFMCVAYVENGKLIYGDELDEKLGRIAAIRKKISKAE